MRAKNCKAAKLSTFDTTFSKKFKKELGNYFKKLDTVFFFPWYDSQTLEISNYTTWKRLEITMVPNIYQSCQLLRFF